MKQKKAAQASIEYLIVLSAFLALLALFTPIAAKIYYSSLFFLDARNAQSLSHEIKSAVKEMELLEDGSSKSLPANPLNEWRLSVNEEGIQIKIENKESGKTKILGQKFEGQQKIQESQFTLKKGSLVTVSKSSNIISIEYSQP
ncbi:MAG: hypothetical protein AB1467_00710 [Candidatus Diapherotrites archaeon]